MSFDRSLLERISDLDWDAELSQAKLSGTASQVEKAEALTAVNFWKWDGYGWDGVMICQGKDCFFSIFSCRFDIYMVSF